MHGIPISWTLHSSKENGVTLVRLAHRLTSSFLVEEGNSSSNTREVWEVWGAWGVWEEEEEEEVEGEGEVDRAM